jgi:DNA-binding NarL/FixJ family response regulator
MTRVVVVADSGSTMAGLTVAVLALNGAHIVGHGNTRTSLDRMVGALCPDLVVVGDLHTPGDALMRLAEIRRAAPAAKIVVLSDRPEAGWLADALRAHASAVLPGNLEPHTLGVVLREVLATEPVVLRRLPRSSAGLGETGHVTGAAA